MKNILLLLLSTLCSCIVIDIYLKYTRITPPTLKTYDNNLGSLNRPNIDYFKAIEGLYIGKTNYDGRFRDDYPKRKRDKRTLRILMFGDSFVEGIDVFSKNHFAQYIEDILKERLHRNVEVLNFGKGNSVIAVNAYYFQNYVSKEYDADLVLFFTEGRDIFYYGADKGGYPSTHYVLDSNSNLVSSYSWRNTWEYKLHQKLSSKPLLKYYDNIAFFRLAYRAMARIKLDGAASLTFGKFVNAQIPDGVNYNQSDSKDTVSLFAQKVFDTVYKYDQGQVVYVTRSFPRKYPALSTYINSGKYKYINIEDTFDKFNIKNTDIDAYYFKATATYGGHWNNEGHKAVGYFLANKILQNIDSYNMPNFQK